MNIIHCERLILIIKRKQILVLKTRIRKLNKHKNRITLNQQSNSEISELFKVFD